MESDRTLKRREVLRRRRDLQRTRRQGSRIVGPALQLRSVRQPDSTADSTPGTPARRIAFLVPGRIRGAVRRNRLKRRLREAYRLNKESFAAGHDHLLIAAPAAADLGYRRLVQQAVGLARGNYG